MLFQSSEELSGAEPLYSKVQKLFYKRNNEEIQRDVRVTVDLSSSLSKVSKQVLHVQLTDDEDPYFLYTLIITEEDYQQLKLSQGLLVDFHNFPGQVVRLLEQCNNEACQSQRFLLFLEEEKKSEMLGDFPKNYLKIVETNHFKHLCHLVLRIELGNDTDIKKLMLRKIKLLKDRVTKGEKCINQMESQLQNQAKILEAKQQEVLTIQQLWNEEKIAFRTESTKELTEETEKLKRSQLEWKIKMEKQWSEMDERHKNNLKEKETEISKLKIENQILLEKHANSEVTIKDQTKQIENLEKDLTSTKWELNTLRKQSAKLDSDYHDKEKSVNTLKTKLAVLEQELKDKCILMNKQQELLAAAAEQKSRLEENLAEKEKYLQKKQTSLQSVTDELVKANEIITKLQKELGVVVTKLKVRTGIALEQEKVVESSRKKITELEQQIVARSKKMKSHEETEAKLKKTLEELNETVEEKNKTISDNERMINWLNKRINDQYKEGGMKWNHSERVSPTTSTPYGPITTDGLFSRPILTSNMNYSNIPGASTIDKIEQAQATVEIDRNSGSVDIGSKGEHLKQQESSVKNNSPSIQKRPESKTTSKAPSVGFKRISPLTQTTSVPSSYFLK